MVVGVGCGHVDEIPGTGGKDIHGLWWKKLISSNEKSFYNTISYFSK